MTAKRYAIIDDRVPWSLAQAHGAKTYARFSDARRHADDLEALPHGFTFAVVPVQYLTEDGYMVTLGGTVQPVKRS